MASYIIEVKRTRTVTETGRFRVDARDDQHARQRGASIAELLANGLQATPIAGMWQEDKTTHSFMHVSSTHEPERDPEIEF